VKKRGRFEVYASILEGCKKWTVATRVMYHANLSYKSFRKHVRFLVEKGLLVERKEKGSGATGKVTLLKATKEGLEFLSLMKRFNRLALKGS